VVERVAASLLGSVVTLTIAVALIFVLDCYAAVAFARKTRWR
jgi:hypothetical protein